MALLKRVTNGTQCVTGVPSWGAITTGTCGSATLYFDAADAATVLGWVNTNLEDPNWHTEDEESNEDGSAKESHPKTPLPPRHP